MLSIFVAKEPKAGAEQLTLGLEELQLVGPRVEEVIQALVPKTADLNLFADQEKPDDVSQEITSAEVPIGDYQQVVFRLKADLPAQYADRAGKKRKVRWEDPTSNSFAVSTSFSVTEGEKTEVFLNLNGYQSIQGSEGADEVVFKPRGDFKKRGMEQKISGPLPAPGIQWVCAYLYNSQVKPGAPLAKPSQKDGKTLNLKKPHGPRMEERTVYETRAQINFDTQYPCKNAFEQAPVRGEEYRLRQAPPGMYAIRFFKTDGSFIDLEKDLEIKSPY